jgi:hypothetical protein
MLEESFDPEPERRAGRFEIAGRANPGSEHHVRGRAMADPDAGAPQASDFGGAEMDAVREPDALRHPARLLQEIDWAQAVGRQAEALLVLGLAEMGVELAVVALGEGRAIRHQPLADRKGRAWRERDADVGAGPGIMEKPQHALAVGKDGVLVLNDAVGRQAAVLLAQVHRAARHRHT